MQGTGMLMSIFIELLAVGRPKYQFSVLKAGLGFEAGVYQARRQVFR
jgi:hypothetical protein